MTPSFRLAKVPAELRPALRILSRRYPALAGGAKAPELSFRKLSDADSPVTALPSAKGWTVYYRTVTQALRLVGQLLSGTVPAAETCPFETVGVMIDCSRNAVRTVPYLKSVFERLAVLGYNLVMLYCEETYRLDGEPCFGLHRGGYTAKDIRELDDHAAALGIELVPCLETLGHLEQIFRWKTYDDIHDIGGNILIGEERSYELIEKMISLWADNLRSKKVHLGMDEAWGVGTGAYAKKHGKHDTFEIMCDHLERICKFCRTKGLTPYMWGDMWFRIGRENYNPAGDQDANGVPEAIRKRIPKELVLCYWDYYNDDEAKYAKNLENYSKLHGAVQMSSGIWTWNMFWHSMRHTRDNAIPCIEAARKHGVKEILFTQWGDDGAFCDYDSAFSGVALCAERCYGSEGDFATLEARYAALFGGASYAAVASLGAWGDTMTALMWEDPLMFLRLSDASRDGFWNSHKAVSLEELRDGYRACLKTLAKAPCPKDGNGGSIPYARALAEVSLRKLELFAALTAKRAATPAARRAAVKKALPILRALAKAQAAFNAEFRAMWFTQNRPQGYETTQIRLAGCLARDEEALRRYREFIDGKAADLPELADLDAIRTAKIHLGAGGWARTAHGTVIA